jgi:hypothetical protein
LPLQLLVATPLDSHLGTKLSDAAPIINAAITATDANTIANAVNAASIATISGKQATDEGNITTLQTNVATITGKQTTDEGNIATLQTTVAGLGISSKYLYLSTYAGIDPTGVLDSHAAVQAAFNAAAAANKTLKWDCPVYCKMGTTYANAIFIPSSLSVEFSAEGACITDNIGFPCFSGIDAINVTFTNLTLQYIASSIGAFGDQTQTTIQTAASGYNNVTAAAYMTSVLGNTFGSGMTPGYAGLTPSCSIFYMSGAATGWQFLGKTTFAVPAGVNASAFMPVVLGMGLNWFAGITVPSAPISGITLAASAVVTITTGGSSNPFAVNGTVTFSAVAGMTQINGVVGTITAIGGSSGAWTITTNINSAAFSAWTSGGTVLSSNTAVNSAYPSEMLIEDLLIDGALMGLTGTIKNVQINNFRSIRYSDLQTSAGANVGGVGTWFAPPHASYCVSDNAHGFRYGPFNILNMIDEGVYVGAATRRGVGSGYINSIKFEPSGNSTLNTTLCQRPDGWVQVVSAGYSTGSIRGELITLDTSTLQTGGQTGASFAMVFPSANAITDCFIYANIIDTAAVPKGCPVQADVGTGHTNLFMDIRLVVPDYPVGAAYSPGFGVAGIGNHIEVKYNFTAFTNTTFSFLQMLTLGSAQTQNSTFEWETTGWPLFNGSNLESAKPRLIILGTGYPAVDNGGGNRVRYLDVNNQYEYFGEGWISKEIWKQGQMCVPTAGTTFTSSVIFPSGFALDYASFFVYQNFGTANGLTGIQAGWSGTPTALFAGATQSITTGGNTNYPITAPVALGGSARTLLLTAVGGTGFDGIAGAALIAASGTRIRAAV